MQVSQMFAKKLEAVSLVEEGKIKRVRGWVTSAKVSPQLHRRNLQAVNLRLHYRTQSSKASRLQRRHRLRIR